MHLELGPVDAGDVRLWARMSRRVACEVHADPADLAGLTTPEMEEGWRKFVDAWDHDAALGGEEFRWSGHVDVEQAEYLLHGLDRLIRSERVRSLLTDAELVLHRPFTMHVVQAFVDALSAEGRCHEHLCDQVRASLGDQLDH